MTRTCLGLLEGAVARGARIVDVGAGTGILSVAAALLGADEVVAVEPDPFACDAVRENLAANGVSERVRLVPDTLDAEGLAALAPADGIVANIQSGVLRGLLPGARRALSPAGWLILGGVLRRERAELVEAAEREGLALEEEVAEGEWWSGRFRRPSTA